MSMPYQVWHTTEHSITQTEGQSVFMRYRKLVILVRWFGVKNSNDLLLVATLNQVSNQATKGQEPLEFGGIFTHEQSLPYRV